MLPGLTLENGDVYDEAQLSEHFRGKDVVVNLVGILNERGFGGGGFRRAHTELTRAVLQAMRSAGVPRLLQVSALKAATDAPSYYLRSKGEAEKLIRESGAHLDWTIFQPSVMFGPGDSFLNRFATLLASVPFVFPLARPNARFQPVLVDDVIEALRRCLRGGAGSRQTFELGGPRVYTLREIVELVAKLTGHRRWIIGLPNFAARLQGSRHGLRAGPAVFHRQLSLADRRQRVRGRWLRKARHQAPVDDGVGAAVSGRAWKTTRGSATTAPPQAARARAAPVPRRLST